MEFGCAGGMPGGSMLVGSGVIIIIIIIIYHEAAVHDIGQPDPKDGYACTHVPGPAVPNLK